MTDPTKFVGRVSCQDLRMQWSSEETARPANPARFARFRARVAHALVILEREIASERDVRAKDVLRGELREVESLRDEVARRVARR